MTPPKNPNLAIRHVPSTNQADLSPLRIVQIHSADHGGGAELVALQLHQAFTRLGHDCYLLVGRKLGTNLSVIEIPQVQQWPGQFRLMTLLEKQLGLQYLYGPGSHRLLDLLPWQPDIVLIHSTHRHGGYFDIASLPALSRTQPTFLFLHDMWMMTGHCSYTLGCDRWRHGCGSCPDLTIYPGIPKDGTRINWLRKRLHYHRSTFHVGAPAKWALERAAESPLLRDHPQYLIYNGIDTSVFKPGDQHSARTRLGLPLDDRIVLFLANHGAANPFKDFDTLLKAIVSVKCTDPSVTLVAVGHAADAVSSTSLPGHITFRPYASDRRIVADYYRAADVFCHATREDVCPLTVLEAQCCGTPVIATRVGGIPEIILDRQTGRLVPVGQSERLAHVLEELISSPTMTRNLGQAAARHALETFSLERQAQQFLDLFHQAVPSHDRSTP